MIFNTKLYKENKEDFIAGLVCGLVCGLLCGLVCGLLYGLVCGLVCGLGGGLVGGLVWGLVWGLLWGLLYGLVVILINFSEALPFIQGFYPILFFIMGIVILTEVLFLLNKSKPKKKEDKFWFTCKRKLEAFFETVLIFSIVIQVYILIREVNIRDYLPFILKWVGYIGGGLIIIGLIVLGFYLWIKLNEQRYKK